MKRNADNTLNIYCEYRFEQTNTLASINYLINAYGKIGIDVDHDISIVRKISKWGKGQVRIRVDGNEGYSPNDLRRFLSGTHDVQLEFVEQPFKAPAKH